MKIHAERYKYPSSTNDRRNNKATTSLHINMVEIMKYKRTCHSRLGHLDLPRVPSLSRYTVYATSQYILYMRMSLVFVLPHGTEFGLY